MSVMRFRVIRCSSHDDGYAHSELENQASNPRDTKGWLSARFCDYPQRLILQFEQAVDIRKIQILSHQSKIAKSIELYAGLSTDGSMAYEKVQWRGLGYLALDDNKRSKYVARELRSVYVNCNAEFLQLVIPSYHVNPINYFNQVGIVAINVIGSSIPSGRDRQLPRSVQGTATDVLLNSGGQSVELAPEIRKQIDFMTRQKEEAILREDFSKAHQLHNAILELRTVKNPGVSGTGVAPGVGSSGASDVISLRKIQYWTQKKQLAIAHEDYDQAKVYKRCIDRLHSVLPQIDALAQKKRAALAKEDFDEAKRIKMEIERLRAVAEDSSGPPPIGGNSRPTSMAPEFKSGGNVPSTSVTIGPGRVEQKTIPERSTTQKPPTPWDERPLPAQQNRGSKAAVSPFGPGGPQDSTPVRPESRPLPALSSRMPGIASENERPLDIGRGGGENVRGGADEGLNPNNPDPMKPALRQELESVSALYGDTLVRCCFSSNWMLRAHGLQSIADQVYGGHFPNSTTGPPTPMGILQTLSLLLSKTLKDRVSGVFLSACHLLRVAVDRVSGDCEAGARKAFIDPFISILMDRVAENNTRVFTPSADTLMYLAFHQLLSPTSVGSGLVRPLKRRESASPLVLKRRAELLLHLIPKFGMGPMSGVELQAVMKICLIGLEHRDGSVRDAMSNVCTAIYLDSGERALMPFLKKLRKNVLGKITERFQEADESRGPFFERKTVTLSERDARFNDSVAQNVKNINEQVGGSSKGTGSSVGSQSRAAPRGTRGGGRGERKLPANNPPVSRTPVSSSTAGRKSPPVPTPRNKPNQQPRSGGKVQHSPVNQRPKPTAQPSTQPSTQNDAPSGDMQPVDVNESDAYWDTQVGICQFCGMEDESLVGDTLDLHYWSACPMLVCCAQCEQVIEIPLLNEHILSECDVRGTHDQCPRCMEPVPLSKYHDHVKSESCAAVLPVESANRCPLCHTNIPPGVDGWKLHLLVEGCPNNPRKTPTV